ncbi:early nodulin-like protein 1 [Cajanus cajan]|uniref:Early nodulin-like protein 1 n=1 Tax=Cajanus cajan TaxID=3821 RepID=A0A151SHM2_CAJCA|nr:early nodulin-like protein 1 [Cajanus cajan]KYP54255.1 Early nodulin-like protein 1 [Cajanus cajan]
MASLLVVLCTCVIVFMAATNSVEASVQFKVGWHVPAPNNTEFYIKWAEKNRFQIGDALVFEYQNDSVLSVEKWDYINCDASNPITAFDNGKSTFNLDRPGDFYFISGTDYHCNNGQKLVVDVMHPHPIPKSPPPISLPPQSFPPMAPPPSDDSSEVPSSASTLLTTIVMSSLVTFVSVMMLLAP